MVIDYLRSFGKNLEKEFGKQFGTRLFLKEIEQMKKKVESIMKKMKFLIVVVICSWDYFVIFLRVCNNRT